MQRTRLLLPLLLIVTALLVPAGAQAVPRGFFGIVPQTGIGPKDLGRMRAGGVETLRMPLSWAGVQRSRRSDYDWSGFDATVAAAAENRIEVLPVLFEAPGWATGNARRMPVDSARQRQAWAQFVAAAVERYGRRGEFWEEHGPGSKEPLPRLPIRAWQVWNEENFFYFTKPVSPGRYARLLAVTRPAIRRADPRAEIVLGGLFGHPRQRPPQAMDSVDFLEQLYRSRGVKANFDAVALHPYAADAGELRSSVEAVRRTMVRHGDRRSGLYVTEIGWGSAYNPRAVAFEVGLQGQARELRRAYGYLLANRGRLKLRQVDWFTWKDLQGSCAFCDSSGLFRQGARFKPKPAWRAFVQVTRRARSR
jgi:polysaccharide biosynthesis protein PslG